MGAIASQITSLTIVYSTVYSDADQRKHQSSASLAFVWGIHRDWWIPRTKGQLRGKCFHLMTSSCLVIVHLMSFSFRPMYQQHSISGLGLQCSFLTRSPHSMQKTEFYLNMHRWLLKTAMNLTEQVVLLCLSVSWWRHQMETFSAFLAFVRGIHR